MLAPVLKGMPVAHIDYYFSTPSPWAYLAGNRLEEIATRHGAAITYKPVDLKRLILQIENGMPRPERSPGRMAYRDQELARWAAHLDMPLNLRPAHFPVNGAPSAYVVIAAQAAGADVGPLVQALGRAVWAEDRDIADDAVLRDILSAQGLEPGLVDSGLLLGAETFTRNLREAAEAGAFGVPFYVLRETDERFWGQDRLDFLDRALARL